MVKAQVPLQLWHDGKEYSRHGAQQATASQCATEKIAALLNGAGTLAGPTGAGARYRGAGAQPQTGGLDS